MKNNTTDYSFLYQQKCEEYDMLNDEYQEMKDISSQIERELESEVEHLTKEKHRLLAENEKVQNQIKELKKKSSSEIIYLEKKLDLLTGDNTRIQEELRTKNRIITQNEIEVERLESQLRESQCIINDLEYKIDHTLEKLAMVQSQLEENKAYNEEEVQRLKDKLRESQSEVLAYRTREAKQEQTSKMEAENVYIDEGAKQYAAYQGIAQRDPSPIKKLKVELGKRTYRQLYVESSKRAQESNGPVFHKPRSYNSSKNGMSFSVNDLKSAQNNNGFQDGLRDLYSLNMMNQTNNKSLLIVNDLIGELDKHSRKLHNNNLQNNQNVNPNLMGMNAENQDLFKTNMSLNLDQPVSNNYGNLFSNINQQPTFTNFFENA